MILFRLFLLQASLVCYLVSHTTSKVSMAEGRSVGHDPPLGFLQQRVIVQKNERIATEQYKYTIAALPRLLAQAQESRDGRSRSNRLIKVLMAGPFSSDDDNSSADAESTSSNKSVARAGGRSSSGRPSPTKTANSSNDGGTFNGIVDLAKKAVPILLLLSLIKGLFGFLFGSGSNPSYVYYQSTVYESRTYDADGQIERIRKESVKSNMPSMINGNKQEEGDIKSSYLQQSSDEDFDRDLDRIIQRSMNTW